MNMVFCRGCGQNLHETAPTCPHCGFVQLTQSNMTESKKSESIWMAATAFVAAVICFLNWFDSGNWTQDIKTGLWLFSIVGILLSYTTLREHRKGKVIAGISLAVSILTILIVIGSD